MSATLLVPDKFNSTGIIRVSEYDTITMDKMRKATLSFTLPIKNDQSGNLTITVCELNSNGKLLPTYSYVWCRIENGRAIVDDDKYVGNTAGSLRYDIFQVKSQRFVPENIEFSGPLVPMVTTMVTIDKYSKRVMVPAENKALRDWSVSAIQSSLDDICSEFERHRGKSRSSRKSKSSRKISAKERDENADKAAAEIAAENDSSDTSSEY